MWTKIKKCAAAALLLLAVATAGGTPAVQAAEVVPANEMVPPGTGTKLFVGAANPTADLRAVQAQAVGINMPAAMLATTALAAAPTDGVVENVLTGIGGALGAAAGAMIAPLFGLDPFAGGVLGSGLGAGAAKLFYNLLKPLDPQPLKRPPVWLSPIRP